MSVRDLKRFSVKIYLLAQKIGQKIANQFKRVSMNFTPGPLAKEHTLSLEEAVVVITGSTRGIGYALAESFLGAGSTVIINGRQEESLNAALNQLAKRSPKLLAVKADVSSMEGAQELIRQTLQKFGKIDVLINNAAVTGPTDKKIWEVSLEEWQNVLTSNITTAFLCIKELVTWAKTSKHKVRIINVSSGIVGQGAANLGAYNVSKMGLEGLTLSVAADSAEADSLVSIVSIKPRSVATDMTKAYFSNIEHTLMDDPRVLAPAFLYAAIAPVGEIMGRSLSEPSFCADPKGEIVLNNSLSSLKPYRIEPEIFRPENEGTDKSGAYMHLLQNPLGFYPSVAQAVAQAINSREIHGYPDPNYTQLRQALNVHLKLPPEYFTFAAGSSELIERSLRVFSQPRANIIITKPTWGSVVWPAILKYGYRPLEIPSLGSLKEKNIRHDLAGILSKINHQTRLIYLVNPCNPTGSALDKNDLKNFLQQIPRHVTVLLDEAYIDYVQPEKRFDLPAIVDQLPCRVIGLRTFSKFFALAGFRIGYAYGRPEVLDYLNRLEIPFLVSNVAQLAAVTALKDKESQKKTYENNLADRQKISAELTKLNIAHQPSQTSFILFECPVERPRMRAALKEQGIFMPNIDAVFAENFAMTAVGLPEHNEKILNYLRKR